MVVSVDYQSPSECPDEATYGSELHGRNPKVAVASAPTPTDSGPRLVVRVIRRMGAGGQVTFHGEFVVRYPDGTAAKRSVDGEACSSVVDALALMSAMTLDPTGTLAGKSTTASPPDVTPSVPPVPPASTQPRTAKDADRGIHLSAGIGANAVWGIGPAALPEGLGFLELSWSNESLFSPAVRVAVSYAGGPSESVTGGSVTTSRTEARVDACPVRWEWGAAWRALPCAVVEGGALAATGDGVTPSLHALRPWVAAGLAGKVQWRAGRSLFLEVVGGATVPFVRDHFYFEPNATTTVFQAPVVTGFFGIGVGYTIL